MGQGQSRYTIDKNVDEKVGAEANINSDAENLLLHLPSDILCDVLVYLTIPELVTLEMTSKNMFTLLEVSKHFCRLILLS